MPSLTVTELLDAKAKQQLTTLFSDSKTHINEILKGDGIAKSTVTDKIDGTVALVLGSLDRADLKEDGLIHKQTMLDKASQVGELLSSLSSKISGEDFSKALQVKLNLFPQDKISKNLAEAYIKNITDAKINAAYTKLDQNKDEKISVTEAAFYVYDTDRSGSITLTEAGMVGGASGLGVFFASDKNGDFFVTKDEAKEGINLFLKNTADKVLSESDLGTMAKPMNIPDKSAKGVHVKSAIKIGG